MGWQWSVNGSETTRLPVRKLLISMIGIRADNVPSSITEK